MDILFLSENLRTAVIYHKRVFDFGQPWLSTLTHILIPSDGLVQFIIPAPLQFTPLLYGSLSYIPESENCWFWFVEENVRIKELPGSVISKTIKSQWFS